MNSQNPPALPSSSVSIPVNQSLSNISLPVAVVPATRTRIVQQQRNQKSCCSCCTKCCHMLTNIMDARMVFGPWMTLVDVGTDILACYELLTNVNEVPEYFGYIMAVIIFCSLRSQALWLLIICIDDQISDGGFFGGKYRPFHVFAGYIPVFGSLILFSSNQGSDNLKENWLTFARRAFILIAFDLVYCCTAGIVLGITFMIPLALYTWVYWLRYLCCCQGGCCKGDRPSRTGVSSTSTVGVVTTSMSWEGVRLFLSLYEGLLEAFPQAVVGSYIFYEYLWAGSTFGTYVKSMQDFAHLSVTASIVMSVFRVSFGIIFLMCSCGNEGTTKEQIPNPGMVHQRPTPHDVPSRVQQRSVQLTVNP